MGILHEPQHIEAVEDELISVLHSTLSILSGYFVKRNGLMNVMMNKDLLPKDDPDKKQTLIDTALSSYNDAVLKQLDPEIIEHARDQISTFQQLEECQVETRKLLGKNSPIDNIQRKVEVLLDGIDEGLCQAINEVAMQVNYEEILANVA